MLKLFSTYVRNCSQKQTYLDNFVQEGKNQGDACVFLGRRNHWFDALRIEAEWDGNTVYKLTMYNHHKFSLIDISIIL